MKLFRILLLISLMGIIMVSAMNTHVLAEDTSDTTSDKKEDETDKTDNTDQNKTDDQDQEKEKEAAYERQVEMEKENKKFKIQSELKNGASKDKFEITFDVDSSDKAEIEIKYKTESGSNETSLKYRVEMEQIVEYVDSGAADGYQVGEEVSTYTIGQKGWDNLVYDYTNQVHTIVATTSDGVFKIVLKLSEVITPLDNATLTPNSLKIDIEMNNFPYTQSNSSLAIVTKIKSSAASKVEDDTEEETVGFGSDEKEVRLNTTAASGFFSWVEHAMADGKLIDVLSSPLSQATDDEDLEESESSTKLVFSFNAVNATKIVWDPKIGVTSEATVALLESILNSDLPSGFQLPGFQFYYIIGIFGLFALMNRRKLIRR